MPVLTWIGKDKVVNHDKELPFRVLKKNKDLSEGENSENLLVEGDDAKNIGVDKFSKTQKLHNRLFSLPIFYSGSELVIDSYLADLKIILDKSLAG